MSVGFAEAKNNDSLIYSPKTYPQPGGKEPGMGHDYQKNTSRSGKGKPEYQGGKTEKRILEDVSEVDNQLDKAAVELQLKDNEVKDKKDHQQTTDLYYYMLQHLVI